MANSVSFVGRAEELRLFAEILDQRKPALVVVTGEPGMGKTTLLKEFAASADRQAWRVAQLEEDQSVRLVTTEPSFCASVRGLLKISEGPLVSDFHADDTLRQPIPGKRSHELEPKSEPRERQSASRSQRPSRTPGSGLVEQLRTLAPLVLLIDGFRPDAAFAAWFTAEFLAPIRQMGAPIVIAIGDTGSQIERLRPIADRNFHLASLDRADIRRFFDTIRDQIVPPLEATELEEYVDFARVRPETLSSLARVLCLSRAAQL